MNTNTHKALAITKESFKRIYLPVLILPIGVAITSFLLIKHLMPMETFKHSRITSKTFWDTVGLVTISIAFALACIRAA